MSRCSLPGRSPLQQLHNSNVHREMLTSLDDQSKQRFTEVREFQVESMPELDITPYWCLDNGEWLNDEVIHQCIQLIQQGMPQPTSDGARNCAPPHADRDGGPSLAVDWDEVCILDPQNAKQIMAAYQTRDYSRVLKFMQAKCLFNSVKRIVLPLNTSWDSIAMTDGTHWMLAEMHLSSDAVFLYDWITDKPRTLYDNLAGACSTVCPCPALPCCHR